MDTKDIGQKFFLLWTFLWTVAAFIYSFFTEARDETQQIFNTLWITAGGLVAGMLSSLVVGIFIVIPVAGFIGLWRNSKTAFFLFAIFLTTLVTFTYSKLSGKDLFSASAGKRAVQYVIVPPKSKKKDVVDSKPIEPATPTTKPRTWTLDDNTSFVATYGSRIRGANGEWVIRFLMEDGSEKYVPMKSLSNDDQQLLPALNE